MSEIAPPAVARSGGATSPHSGMVPRPAAPHPQPSGVLRDGTLCPPCATAPAGRKPGRGLSREAFTAIAAPIRARGGLIEEVAAATGLSVVACAWRCRSYGLPRQKLDKHAEIVRLYRAGWQPAEIGARLGMKAHSVVTYANAMRRKGFDVPRAPATGGPQRRVNYGDVCRLANEGLRQKDIAAQLGITEKAVSRILIAMRKEGVPLPPGGRWPKGGA